MRLSRKSRRSHGTQHDEVQYSTTGHMGFLAVALLILTSLPSGYDALSLEQPRKNSVVLRNPAKTERTTVRGESAVTMDIATDFKSNTVRKNKKDDEDDLLCLDFSPKTTLGKPSPYWQSSTTLGNKNSDTEVTDFELGVGRALDTLRADYPYLLTDAPNYNIYAKDIEVVDPSGVHVHGLTTYKNTFRVIHTLVRLLYSPERSAITFKMCFDTARQNIRIAWNARVVPREILGGVKRTLFVDGISVYELDRQSGNITQHRIEKLLMNQQPVKPEEGVIAALNNHHAVTVPNMYGSNDKPNTVLEFRPPSVWSSMWNSPQSSLFMMEGAPAESDAGSSSTRLQSRAGGDSDVSSKYPGLDWDAFDRKNKSRKKFGLKPLTPEEFLELESQVKQMDVQNRQKARSSTASSSTAEMKKENLIDKLFGGVLKNTCESNFDCERPQICCDFGFKKMCCASGTPVGNGVPQYAPVPVPVDINIPNREPNNF